jgi:hypothetical protein
VYAYLTQSINQMVLESQLPPQNRQLIVSIGNSKQKVDDFVGGIDFLQPFDQYFE